MKNLMFLVFFMAGLSQGMAGNGLDAITDMTNIDSESSLSIQDVPLDSIPDTIYLTNKTIEGQILGFLPEGSKNPKALLYQSTNFGPSIEIPLSQILRIDDGKTRLSVDLPSPTFYQKHGRKIRIAAGSCAMVPLIFIVLIFMDGGLPW
ncbi:MAG: hypothetical protein HQ556_16010 [Candidatus Marinimicrobia bacterium]|nr:hypothetical protein [Candidatus Neomarinimicrobiota bacterium]